MSIDCKGTVLTQCSQSQPNATKCNQIQTIGSGSNHPEQAQVIINLDQDIPAFASSFERIVEIVGGSETNKQLARQRYRQYREGDYDIHDHKIETINENG